MFFPDVNIFVYALREETPRHLEAKVWLENALSGVEGVGLFEPVLISAIRIVTNRRIFKTPTPMPIVLDFIAAVKNAPAARSVSLLKNWDIFEGLCRDGATSGDDIPDVYLAAISIENDAVFVSTDKGFSRFNQLKWIKPF